MMKVERVSAKRMRFIFMNFPLNKVGGYFQRERLHHEVVSVNLRSGPTNKKPVGPKNFNEQGKKG
jgi:hypothetical protein